MNQSFQAETQLFENLLPSLLKTDAHRWFVAWDGQAKGVFDTFGEASDFIAKVPRDVDVLIREITTEEVRLPLYFIEA
jgi:hypothetical protein